jgi:tight adherence protein B
MDKINVKIQDINDELEKFNSAITKFKPYTENFISSTKNKFKGFNSDFIKKIEAAMENMAARVDSMDLKLVISAILIQRQVGGNMSEILDNISDTIKDRLKLKNDIRVMTATGRISSMVVGLIPIFISGVLMLLNPEFIMKFFETSMGVTLLIIACVMEVVGLIVIKKIVTIKY